MEILVFHFRSIQLSRRLNIACFSLESSETHKLSLFQFVCENQANAKRIWKNWNYQKYNYLMFAQIQKNNNNNWKKQTNQLSENRNKKQKQKNRIWRFKLSILFFFKFSLISVRLQITLLINTVLISKTRAVGGTTSFRNPSSLGSKSASIIAFRRLSGLHWLCTFTLLVVSTLFVPLVDRKPGFIVSFNKSSRLRDHVIVTTHAWDDLSCALSCLHTKSCFSFNFKESSQVCELNHSNRMTSPKDLIMDFQYSYYELEFP